MDKRGGAHLKFQSHAEYLAVLLQNLHWCMDFHIPGAAVTDVLTQMQSSAQSKELKALPK